MTRSSHGRTLRRNVRKGMIQEIERRTGRHLDAPEVREMIRERIKDKEYALPPPPLRK